jgi:hypothetical protein
MLSILLCPDKVFLDAVSPDSVHPADEVRLPFEIAGRQRAE